MCEPSAIESAVSMLGRPQWNLRHRIWRITWLCPNPLSRGTTGSKAV